VRKPVFYARPEGTGCELVVEAALASWDRAGSRGQVRSAAFIDAACAAVTGQLNAAHPLALRLDVGLQDTVALHALNDLDNYLFPLVPKLAERMRRDVVSVWATKRHRAASSVCVAMPIPVNDPGGTYQFDVATTASATTSAFKEQIRDQIIAASPLPGVGVAVQIAFVVGPRRVWPNLWKPTIDSLGSILGRDEGAREWNARDGRITDLGLHCVVDEATGSDVLIAIRASSMGEQRPA
jgi:hypothetical protein